jgi:nitroimidazol reductase NimA-like FMN-containing flavoprotein (pyridoxamine 5'-phosphate oxidase superfamily)
MKIVQTSAAGSPMSEQKVREFLASKINLQIATLDKNGDPIIQPVWYYHDPENERIYIITSKTSKKAANIRRKNLVYFNLDEDAFPMRCVKGKAKANISEDPKFNVSVVRKMVLKYLGNTENPTAKQMLDNAGSSDSALIELTPLYYSAWDFTK